MKRTGFTFMELLIALTIFSIIASSIYYTLGAGIKVYSRGNSIINDNQKLRIFFDAVSLDMRNAVTYSEEEADFYIESEWLVDKVSFPAVVNVFADEEMSTELAKVSYYMDKNGDEGNRVVRKYANVKYGFDEEVAEEEILLEGLDDFTVEGISFDYCYAVPGFEGEYDWKEREDDEFEKGIPRGVKINLALKDKLRKKDTIFTKTVFIAMGELGDEI